MIIILGAMMMMMMMMMIIEADTRWRAMGCSIPWK
jgi:hypothetical protein